MRKVSVIVSVCLICLTLCLFIPFDGNAYSLNGEAPCYACLQFDSFETPYYSFPYPFNSASDSVHRYPFAFGDDIAVGFISYDGIDLTGYLNGLGGSWLKLYSTSQLVRPSDLAKKGSFLVYPGNEDMTLHYADISVSVLSFDVASGTSDHVAAYSDDLSMRVWCGDNGSLNIGVCLSQLLDSYGYSDHFVMLYDLCVTIPYSITDFGTPSIMMSCKTNNYEPDLFFQQWVYEQDIEVNSSGSSSSDFNLGSWLADCLTGFVQVEIFPGFSIDKIFYIILVIGVLLWFIKIIS